MLFGAFQPPSPHRAAPSRSFPGAESQELAGILLCPERTSTFIRTQILLSDFCGRKAPSSMGKISTAEVLRLRATSAVSGDKSVRRSAQDDDSVGV
jgi:hypothetical protein